MSTGWCALSCLVLLTATSTNILQTNAIEAVQLNSQFNSLSLPKELISNSIFAVHLQSLLMIMASERDFSFNISKDFTLNYLRHPQSYRTTLLQISSNMYQIFSSSYSSMYHLQLDVKRIPDYIKTILRLIQSGSANMISRMLPTILNNIARISNDNEILIKKNIDQFTNLLHLLDEVRQLPIDLSSKFDRRPSERTDLILYNGFNSKDALEKISMIIQQIIGQLGQIDRLIIDLNVKTKFNLSVSDQMVSFLPALYTLENTAHFLYELSSICTTILGRHVLDQLAGMGRYLVLATNEERAITRKDLSKQFSNTLREIEQLFIERQNEFDSKNLVLQQVYEKLFNSIANQHYEKSLGTSLLL